MVAMSSHKRLKRFWKRENNNKKKKKKLSISEENLKIFYRMKFKMETIINPKIQVSSVELSYLLS